MSFLKAWYNALKLLMQEVMDNKVACKDEEKVVPNVVTSVCLGGIGG